VNKNLKNCSTFAEVIAKLKVAYFYLRHSLDYKSAFRNYLDTIELECMLNGMPWQRIALSRH